MTLFDAPNPEEQGTWKYLGLIIFAITLPVSLFFSHIGKGDFGDSVGICLGMNIFAILMCWDLRRRFWFWVVIALVLALHIPVILMIHWPNEWVSKFTLLPIGLADLLITVGVVRFVQKFIV
jgi:hypothetical protein